MTRRYPIRKGKVNVMKPVKLTKTAAVKLMRRVVPVPSNLISGGACNHGAIRFTAQLDSEWLKITCENDWYTHNGCIGVTVSDTSGGGHLTMYFNPNTFERDYSAEEFSKKEAAREAREQWIDRVGKEQAHKMIDLYWEN